MSQTLFRKEALLATNGSRYGAAVFYQPPGLRVFCVGLLLTFLGFLLFAGLAGFSRTESARGHLNPVAGAVEVYAGRTGVLQRVEVVEGQRVGAGQVLAIVMVPQMDQYGHGSIHFQLQQIDRQSQHLEEQMVLTKERATLDDQQRQQQVLALQSELQLLREQQSGVDSRLSLSEQEYERSARLHAQGVLSDSLRDQQLDRLYSAKQLSRNNLLLIEGREQALTDARHALVMRPLTLQQELLAMAQTSSQLLARRKDLEMQGVFAVTAPTAGVVSNLLVPQGSALELRQPLLTLLPEDSALEAWLYLPSRALGEVTLQQEIMLAYDAYPVRTYGTFPATVTFIADTAMDPREIDLPAELREPVYLIRASLPVFEAAGSSMERLRPGMQFSAQIVTARQTILQRIFAPLRSLGRKL